MFSQHQTEEIRRALQGGVTPLDIARRLSVSLIAIAHVIATGLEHAVPGGRSDDDDGHFPTHWARS